MTDGSRLFPRAPAAIIERLQAREAAQRAETKRRGLPAEPVNVEGLLLLQRNRCACGCNEPLDFDSEWDVKSPPAGYPIIAHRLARGSKGGHQVGNVFIDRWACNKRDAAPDTSGAASVKRFTPDHSKKEARSAAEDEGNELARADEVYFEKSKIKSKIQSRPFDKTKTRTFAGKVRERVK